MKFSSISAMYCNAEEYSCRFNKTSILINSAPLRISVIRSAASWFGKCDCSSKSSTGVAESRRRKDGWSWGRTRPPPPPPLPSSLLPRSSSTISSRRRASFQYPRAAKRRIPPSPPPLTHIARHPPGSPTLLCRFCPLPPSCASFLLLSFHRAARELPLFALSSPNGRAASILTSALRIYFGLVP